MATTISSGTNPYKLGSPPDFGTLYSGRALEFDGVTDYVTIGQPSALNFGSGDHSYSIWVKSASWASDDVILSRYEDGNNKMLVQYATGSPNKLLFVIEESNVLRCDVRCSFTPVNDKWYHFVITLDNGTAGNIYIDGELQTLTDNTITSGDTDISADLVLGRYTTTSYDLTMCNVQVWDKVWSLSDVQYAYTHPEKLITDNSAVTSGTTISNLKLWLPCTEGNPRSPQTTVYDGSPKELGSELLGTDDDDWTLDAGLSISEGTITFDDSGNLDADYDGSETGTFTFTTDMLYKFVFTTSGDDPQMQMRDHNGNELFATASYATGTHTLYYKAVSANNTNRLVIRCQSAGSSFDISNISLKEVQMGNHGTTTFYGDELFDADAAAGTVVDQWDAYVNNTIEVDSGKIKITYVDYADGAKLYLKDAKDLSADLVVGRTYRFACDAYVPSGDTVNVGIYNGTTYATEAVTATSLTAITPIDFVCDSASNTFISNYNNMTTGDIIWLDNLSLKEIGVATGWTTADAEPLIPQTALMGMSKPMVFDGVDDYVVIDGAKDLLAVAADWSLSIWFKLDALSTGNNQSIFSQQIGVNDRVQISQNGSGSEINCTIDENTYYHASGAISANTWHHIVLVWDTDPSGVTLYVNGSVMSGTTGADALGGAAGIDIGRQVGAQSTTYMQGCVNEIAMWSSKLTLAEVQAVFNDGVALDVSSDSGDYESSGDLVGYWRNNVLHTDGKWKDLTESDGSGNNGTVNGSPDTILIREGTTTGKDILGFPLTHTNNGWLNLDGSEYVEIADNDLMSFGNSTGDKPFSVEAWFKADDPTDFPIIAKGVLTSDGEWRLELNGADYLQFSVFDESADASEKASYNSALSANTWYHVVATYDGRGGASANAGISLYVNGSGVTESLSDANTHVAMENLTGSVLIGKYSTQYANGNIDEVKIYNRVLSATEITKNYKHGLSKHS